MINFECAWIIQLVPVWSKLKINALSVNTGDHTTSCCVHYSAIYIMHSFVSQKPALSEWPDPSFYNNAGDAIHPVLHWEGIGLVIKIIL